MKKICAFGSKVIVKREQEEEKKKGNLIMVNDERYCEGSVVSVGKLVANDLFLDPKMKLEPGSLVVYSSFKSNPLGLGFPDTFDVIEAEDVIGVISQDEEHGE